MAKKGAVTVAIVPVEDKWSQAEAKAENPQMTLDNNPLAKPVAESQHMRLVDHNMDRLHQDAVIRRGANGAVYDAIMSARYN